MINGLFKENNRIRWKQLEWHLSFINYKFQESVDPAGKNHRLFRKRSNLQAETIPLTLQSEQRFGKVTDCGYDTFNACWTALPADYDVTIQVSMRVKSFCNDSVPTGQESFGLFLRDTMEPERLTGHPYSNMVALGAWKGCWNVFGRCGISNADHGHIQNFYVNDFQRTTEKSGDNALLKDPLRLQNQERIVHLTLQRSGNQFIATLRDDKSFDLLDANDTENRMPWPKTNLPVQHEDGRYVINVQDDPLACRDGNRIYLGFLSTRGSEIIVLKETFALTIGQKRQPANGSISEGPVKDSFCDDSPEAAAEVSIPEITSVIWASPDGLPSGDGTCNAPFDLITAIRHSAPNTEIRLQAGTYRPNQSIILENSGTGSKDRKRLVGDPAAKTAPIIDFSGRGNSLCIKGNYWELERIRVTCGMGIQIQGNHNYLKRCEAFRNLETGILIRHADNDSLRREWPSFNLIEDCVSRENCDPSEQNADGFACKVAAGPGNRFVGCISYLNADDGFDLFAKNRKIGAVYLDHCESYLNGYRLHADGTLTPSLGNGNGFKLGGSGESVHHVVQDCIAQGNCHDGFTNNSNPSMNLIHCTSHDNARNDSIYYVYGTDPDGVQEVVECQFGPTEDFDIERFRQEIQRRFGERKNG